MGKNNQDSVKIFEELFATIELLGVTNTINLLQDAKDNFLKINPHNQIDDVLSIVSEVTNLTKRRILKGSDRSDERKIALALVVYHVKNKLGISYKEMMKIFDKDKAALCRYYTIIDKLPKVPKTDFDKKITAYNKKLSQLLTKD